MTERPILFSGPMVQALMRTPPANKTETRRVVRLPPWMRKAGIVSMAGRHEIPWNQRMSAPYGTYCLDHRAPDHPMVHVPHSGGAVDVSCPYGYPGDRLWVRESIRYSAEHDNHYWAADDRGIGEELGLRFRSLPRHPKSIPSIHMPRWASRITLLVEEIRLERLTAIDELGALAEGCIGKIEENYLNGVRGRYVTGSALTEFIELWDRLNAQRGFGYRSNPLVWVVRFSTEIDARRVR